MRPVDSFQIVTVDQAIADAAGGFVVATQGRGTGLLVIAHGVAYGFTYPEGDTEDVKSFVAGLFGLFHDPAIEAEWKEKVDSLTPMSTETKALLDGLIEFMPMRPLCFVPKSELTIAMSKVVH
jgi:hypothetical protein